jgi:D-alanine-D-alanine ligase
LYKRDPPRRVSFDSLAPLNFIMKIQKHIEIVLSGTPRLSSMGGKSAAMIQALLMEHYTRVGVTLVSDLAELKQLVAKQPDLVILGVKQIPTVDGRVWLSAYLETHGINHLGSRTTAIELDFDKPGAKRIVQAAGLLTALSFTAEPQQYTPATLPLPFPLFVKPPNGGGGKGIGPDSVVRNFKAYEQKVQLILDEFGTPSLVEAYLPGREFSVALIENTKTAGLLAMPIELIAEQNAQGDRILGKVVKANDTEQVVAVVDLALRTRVNRLAKGAFRALGARDYGRIDIRLDERGVPHFLEANLIPGLANHDFVSYFTAACEVNQNMSYETMILSLVTLSLNRYMKPSDLPEIELAALALA